METQNNFMREDVDDNGDQNVQLLENVPKPSTPYMIFLKKFKQQMKQGQKFNLKLVAEIWNSFDQQQKDVYVRIQQQQKQKYDEYLKQCVSQGINLEDKTQLNLEFPTTRIKNIMKQDKSVKCKGTTVIYVNKAVELFGIHLISTIKRNIGAKKKVELKDLWQAINVDRSLGFLQPIIDDYRNTGDNQRPSQKKKITLEVQKRQKPEYVSEKAKQPREITKQYVQPKPVSSSKPKLSTKRISTTQPTLNDMWK